MLSQGLQHLKPGTALEAASLLGFEDVYCWTGDVSYLPQLRYSRSGRGKLRYTLVSYDALGSRSINVPQTECRGINLQQLSQLVDFIRDHAHLWVETFLDISGVGPSWS